MRSKSTVTPGEEALVEKIRERRLLAESVERELAQQPLASTTVAAGSPEVAAGRLDFVGGCWVLKRGVVGDGTT